MRAITRYPDLRMQVVQPTEEYTILGQTMVKDRGIEIRFGHGEVLDHEAAVAVKAFQFHGLPDGVPPETRLAVFDTEDPHWQAQFPAATRQEIVAAVEDFLRENPVNGADYIIIDLPRAPIPFPTYEDVTDMGKLAELLELTGTSLEMVRRYEHENGKRPEVFALLKKLGATEVEVPA